MRADHVVCMNRRGLVSPKQASAGETLAEFANVNEQAYGRFLASLFLTTESPVTVSHSRARLHGQIRVSGGRFGVRGINRLDRLQISLWQRQARQPRPCA